MQKIISPTRKRYHTKPIVKYVNALAYMLLPALIMLGHSDHQGNEQRAVIQLILSASLSILCRNKRLLPSLMRWPHTQKTPKSKPISFELPLTNIIAACIVYQVAYNNGYINTSAMKANEVFILPATLLVTYIYCLIPLLQIAIREKYITNDIENITGNNRRTGSFLLQQLIHSSVSMCTYIYGTYIPIRKLAIMQQPALISRLVNACFVSTISSTLLPKNMKKKPVYLALALLAVFNFNELYPALLFGLSQQHDNKLTTLFCSYLSYCAGSSYYYTNRLIAPILLHFAINISRYADIHVYGLRICPTYPRTVCKKMTKPKKHTSATLLGYGLGLFGIKGSKNTEINQMILANIAPKSSSVC